MALDGLPLGLVQSNCIIPGIPFYFSVHHKGFITTSCGIANQPQTVLGTLFSAGKTLLPVMRSNLQKRGKGACTI